MRSLIAYKSVGIRWKWSSLLLFFILIVVSCIDPINLKIEGGDGVLVVDGLITNQPGPYVVKLSRSISYNSSEVLRVYSVPEPGAQVKISDNHGNVEVLEETAPGSYRTKTIQGIVGNSYTLSIVTSTGSKYTSLEETLLPVPQVKELVYDYVIYERLITNANGDARPFRTESFEIYAVTSDPLESGNNYRWQVDGIFEFFSLTDFPDRKQCWAPLTRLESKIEIASDQSFNGNEFKQFVAIVQYDRPTDFLVKVRQQSLTSRAYAFWESQRDQQINTGSIFDPPPTSISGNIVSENSEEMVLGYFGASAIAKKDLLIDRFVASGFANPVRGIAIRPGDCRLHEPGATNIKPEGF